MENLSLFWKAPEFEHHEKATLWAWGSMVLAIIVLIIAIVGQNFLFAVFIIIAEVLVLTWGHRLPREVMFEINDQNLIIDKRESHLLKTLDHFGIIDLGEDAEYMELGLVFKKFRPIIRILIPRDISKQVEQKLRLYGRKIDMEPTLADTLERLFRF